MFISLPIHFSILFLNRRLGLTYRQARGLLTYSLYQSPLKRNIRWFWENTLTKKLRKKKPVGRDHQISYSHFPILSEALDKLIKDNHLFLLKCLLTDKARVKRRQN